MIMILLLIIVLWALVRFGGKSGRWTAAICVGLAAIPIIAILVAIALPSLSRARASHGSRTDTVSVTTSRQMANATELESATISSSRTGSLGRESTDGLDADIYPSVRSGVVASARSLMRDLRQVTPDGVPLQEVHVINAPDDLTRTDLATVIQERVPGVRVAFDRSAASQPADASMVMLRIEQPTDHVIPGDVRDQQRTLEIELIGTSAKLSRPVRVVPKQWIEDLPGFQKRECSGQWMVSDPGTLAASRDEAIALARRAAAVQLHPQILARASQRAEFSPGLAGGERGRQLIELELESAAMTHDSFVQQFNRGYGTVYRAALLVNASDHQLDQLADVYASSFSAQRTRILHSVLSGAGLILVILVVYVFLNAATKGYYVWSLRIAGTVILGVGIAIVMRL